ncbi:MAG: OmpH family outer membrane protein [Sedimentisphaerales bacterium]|nr:OmpH family outer membrane protein [Sedimentisphaerales bacterium]
MKTKMIIIICVLVPGILFFSHEYTDAQTNSPISRIGVVNIEKVLMECDATKTYSEELGKERQAILIEQAEIKKDILAIEEEVASRIYKVGSPEYLRKFREGAQKEQDLNMQEVNRQELILKSQI